MWICAAVRRVCFCMSVPVFRPNPDISFPESQGFLACLSHFTSKLLAQSYTGIGKKYEELTYECFIFDVFRHTKKTGLYGFTAYV